MDKYRQEEEYEIEVVDVERHDDDGLVTYPVVITKATGIKTLDDVDHIRHMFSDKVNYGYGREVEIKITRKIHLWCRVCRAYIGNKTMPLRIEPYRRHMSDSVEMKVELHVECYRCKACGHHTNFKIQDPILSIY